jgi:hypothetical protein
MVELPKIQYKLLYVQDKCWQKTASELRKSNFTTWTKTRVDTSRWEYLRDHPGAAGFMFLNNKGKEPEQTGKVNVYADEWVRHGPPYVITLHIDDE